MTSSPRPKRTTTDPDTMASTVTAATTSPANAVRSGSAGGRTSAAIAQPPPRMSGTIPSATAVTFTWRIADRNASTESTSPSTAGE